MYTVLVKQKQKTEFINIWYSRETCCCKRNSILYKGKRLLPV